MKQNNTCRVEHDILALHIFLSLSQYTVFGAKKQGQRRMYGIALAVSLKYSFYPFTAPLVMPLIICSWKST